jgi:hypothetical protein
LMPYLIGAKRESVQIIQHRTKPRSGNTEMVF